MGIRRSVFALVFAVLQLGCSGSPTDPGADPGTLLDIRGLVASSALVPVDGGPSVSYVSVVPGWLPDAVRVDIRNTTSGTVIPSVQVVDDGFDPVAIPASVGDRLELSIVDGAGRTRLARVDVLARRVPRVVRTSVRPQATDVPVDAPMRVVFSEPIDPSTLENRVSIYQVGEGGGYTWWHDEPVLVPGEPWIADLVLPSPLRPATRYELWVTEGIQGQSGVPVAPPLGIAPDGWGGLWSVPFTTRAEVVAALNGRIAFVSDRDGVPYIYVVDAETGLLRLAMGEAPAWSPDGRRIAFHTWPSGVPNQGLSEARVIGSDGSGERALIGGDAKFPAWSPDGRLIAFSRGGNIFRVETAGSGEALLLEKDAVRQAVGGIADGFELARPSWSPDGRRIAFLGGGSVMVANADGTAPHRIPVAHHVGGELWGVGRPAWSPEGTRLGIGGWVGMDPVPWIVSAWATSAGGDMIFHKAGRGPDWSPDGMSLVYSIGPDVTKREQERIYTWAVNGGSPPTLIVAAAVNPANPRYSDYDPVWWSDVR